MLIPGRARHQVFQAQGSLGFGYADSFGGIEPYAELVLLKIG